MGEGIGRALGSGPLLIQALGTALPQNVDFQKKFHQQWSASYGRRFWLGNLLRWLLNHPRLSVITLKFILKRRRLAKALLPIFHGR
jgi:hypothetical protein